MARYAKLFKHHPGVAQVVARLTGGQEAAGSSPVTRTISSVHNQPEGWKWTLDFLLSVK